MALAVRALGRGDGDAPPEPAAVLRMVERVMSHGDARGGALDGDLGPEDARALLRAWVNSIGLGLSDAELLALLQSDDFSHADLLRRARRWHERKLAAAVGETLAAAGSTEGWGSALLGLFDACVPVVPYVPATAFLGREKQKLSGRGQEPVRVALVADAIGGMHGVTHTLDEIRDRGVPGFEVEVIGTDMNVDRRLSAVAEVDVPFYAGLKVGVPSPLAVVEALAEGRYGLVHLCSPGPAGVAAALTARILELPLASSYHTELAAYARLRSGDPAVALAVQGALGAFYGASDVVLSPSAASDARLGELGVAPARIRRWDRGVDVARFDPGKRDRGRFGGPADRVHVLYAGRQTIEKGVDLLADAFLAARERDPRLHLLLAGGGPEEARLRAAPRRRRHVPRLARGRGARGDLRERRRAAVLLADRHLRPGPPRGAGVRPAGRRGRARAARRSSSSRGARACSARPRPRRSVRPSPAWRATAMPVSAWPAAASPRCGRARGTRRSGAWGTAGATRWPRAQPHPHAARPDAGIASLVKCGFANPGGQ